MSGSKGQNKIPNLDTIMNLQLLVDIGILKRILTLEDLHYI